MNGVPETHQGWGAHALAAGRLAPVVDDFDPQFLQPPFQDVFVHRGRRFAVALGWRPLAIWANGRLLARFHLAPPPLAPTLAELLRYCARVRQALVGAGLYTDKARAAVQVLAQAELSALYPALLAAFIQGYGGSVGQLPAPGRAADLPGLRPLAALLAYAGGQRPWSEGSAVLTKEARRKPLPSGMGISRFVRLLPVPAGSWYNANTRTVCRANAVRSRRHDVVWCPK
jgi:hypothetical protein